jgi:stress-induced morphogen
MQIKRIRYPGNNFTCRQVTGGCAKSLKTLDFINTHKIVIASPTVAGRSNLADYRDRVVASLLSMTIKSNFWHKLSVRNE